MTTQDSVNETDESGLTAIDDGCRVGDRVSTRVRIAAAKIGDQMQNAAGAIRDAEPRVGSAIQGGLDRLAQEFERGAAYFAQGRYEETFGKTSQYIRQHPVISIAIGLGVGLLIASKRRQ